MSTLWSGRFDTAPDAAVFEFGGFLHLELVFVLVLVHRRRDGGRRL